MSRIIESQLRIYGSVLVGAGQTATAPSGYEFVKISSSTSTGLTFTNLLAVTGSNYINSSSNVVFGITGATASGGNLSISIIGSPIIGRWYQFRPASGCTAIAYIGK
jgi:hypothetical protein